MKFIDPFLKISSCRKLFFSILLLVIFPMISALSQKIQPRLNQGAILEPQGKIINGAGQDYTSYMKYWNVMHTQNKPLIYMTYIGLRDVTSNWEDGLKADLMSNAGTFQIPQIGLSMTTDGAPSGHYEQDVAAGLYDQQISMFIDGLQSLAIPAYVRIGYEFNGTFWNGYQPDAYKKAFSRITNMIRARGIEVATVWDLAMDGDMNFQDFYPGDSLVDWWGINLFSTNHFTDANAQNFIDSASIHNKPVMIGETTPRYVGVLDGQQSWNNWFAQFFTFIHTYPEVKAFCYINWNWSIYPQWSNWGDACLEQNATIGDAFANEMDSFQYMHASTEQAFRKTLGSSDNSAPSTPGNISLVQLGYPLQLNWNAVTDPSGLSHYIVYKHGALYDYTLTLPYSDKNIAAGDTITYSVSAMDRAGNESQKTADLLVTVPSILNRTINGEFDRGTQDWQLSTYATDASATMNVDTNSIISGRNSCKVTISQITGTDWHIQLWQYLAIHQGCKYEITFKAKASSTKVINLSVQKAVAPYSVYFGKLYTLTTSIQTFTDTVSVNTMDLAKLEFNLGTTGTEQIWIDSVSIIESSPVTTSMAEYGYEKPNAVALLNNYPNPCNTSTKIWYRVTNCGFVSLKVFDIKGREVVTLLNEQKPIGTYSIEWDASGLEGGVYFCKLQNGRFNEVKKILLMNR
jgi:hypothetical protein